MQGTQKFEPATELIINLKKLVLRNHLFRKVDKAIRLDFVDELTAECFCQNNGRPSIDPKVYFRMQVIEYLYGIMVA